MYQCIYGVLSKLKNVLSEIHLLLTPDREHGKVFEEMTKLGLKELKVWNTFLWEQK